MAVKVIAYREDGWMPPNTDYRMWNALTRAYGVELQMITAWEEAIVPVGYRVVVVDQDGTTELGTYQHPSDAVYVFGRTALKLTVTVPHNESIKIKTPNNISLFGISAASIVLYDRQLKEA